VLSDLSLPGYTLSEPFLLSSLRLLPLGRSLRARRTATSAYKAGLCSSVQRLTAVESNNRDRLKAERLTADKVRPAVPKAEIARVPVTTLGRKRTNTLVERTPW